MIPPARGPPWRGVLGDTWTRRYSADRSVDLGFPPPDPGWAFFGLPGVSEVVDSSRSVDLRSKLNGKIEPPGLPQSVLRRGRLARQLTVAAARPVTVVSGGPGWGKTVAAASWAVSGTAQHPVGWLSLDDTDDNPRSFWSNLVTALVATGAVRDRSPLLAHDPGESFGDADLEGDLGPIG